MAKKIKRLEQAPVDVVEAIKRAFIHRGFIPRKYQRNNPLSPEFILDDEESKGDSRSSEADTSNTRPESSSSKHPSKPQETSKKPRTTQPQNEKKDNQDEQEILNKAKEPKNPRLKKVEENDSSSQGDMGGTSNKGATYKEGNDKQGQIESSDKPSEALGSSDKGRKPVKPQDKGSSEETVEDEQRAEKPEGGEGGTAKDWPPQNLRNDITSTDPDISVIDSERGSQEAAKDPEEPEPGKTHEKLIDITEKAHDVIFEADTVFPFTLFPDTITLDREKLTIAIRPFFRTAKIITVPITSMISAEADLGPFFGSVRMTSKYFIDNTHEVNFLWRHDATTIHRLLQGFIIAHERQLELHEIDKDDLKVLLEDLGQGVQD